MIIEDTVGEISEIDFETQRTVYYCTAVERGENRNESSYKIKNTPIIPAPSIQRTRKKETDAKYARTVVYAR